MARLGTRRSYQKRLLAAIGNQSAEELGRLAIDLMENTIRAYDEAGINDAYDDDEFEYTRDDAADRQLESLRDEYRRRFGSGDMGDIDEPASQPAADDITIGINPHTGQEVTVEGEGMEDIEDSEIFGEEY